LSVYQPAGLFGTETRKTQKMTPEQLMGLAALIFVAIYLYIAITPRL
jgi:hypothetical protein